jgi:citrate lyase subunit beta / citryl-CoA lyase
LNFPRIDVPMPPGSSAGAAPHPREALFGAGDHAPLLPVCDHYAGVEARMRKSLELQRELGPVFDVTLDAEDGAPIGGEAEHAALIAELLTSPANAHGRVGARVHPVDHPAFESDVETLVGRAGARVAYLMLPKVNGAADVERACRAVDAAASAAGLERRIPLHALVETHAGLRAVDALAAHPRIESLSFGLMDFVSAHRGAIPGSAMTSAGQFSHPLVVRAKLEIAAACHAHAKVPSHCVVTEFNDDEALRAAARRAALEFGYTRMWSIHPSQIRPIVDAFAPSAAEVEEAATIISLAMAAQWAPIRRADVLHDRASYRYFWAVLERAHRTGAALPGDLRQRFFDEEPSR